MMDAAQHKRVLQGYRSKYAGEYFENMIEASCHHYLSQRIALIQKTPEPMKPIKDLGKGKFVAYYEKHAQPDFKGVMMGGKTIIFDAKHTDNDRLQQSAVSEAQAVSLNYHEEFGADCFVFVSFGFQRYFLAPWKTFKAMKEIFGRKYIKPEDPQLKEYEVPYIGGVLKFLG